MKNYKYIIIGGGMTGSSALMGIRKNDPSGTVAVFSAESHPPYNRPPLSKGLWGKMQISDIMRPMEKYQADLYLQDTITHINIKDKVVIDNQGNEFGYTKLLLATGGTANRFPGLPEDAISFRTLDDFIHLKSLSENKDHFCVIGGGFIGSEITAALTKSGKHVTLIFPELGISDRIFPDDLSLYLNQYYEEQGVQVLSGELVEKVDKVGDAFSVTMKPIDSTETTSMPFDAVVLGIGIKPNVQLAEAAGLSVDNGITVNEYLQTSDPDIYAAGDVANFYNAGLGKRTRAEHEDNANQMGMTAGLNMSGSQDAYTHFPFFYSDLFDLGYEAVGEFSKDHHIIEDWIEPFQKGTLFYMDGDLVRGVVFWNLWGKIDEGRALISNGKTYSESELRGMFA
ncbi:MAG: NAD(P)/FAD-dependent oxidoreductase [Anaerolineaceae bacterium]|nr:NAD(P)/FAD-dependent oxidoreductase [Anaerolineaceae bacterium]MBG0783694.1 NAD(P)/FAD-dependent oxidoreductase [Anaerolineaceae bacterium]